MLNRIILIGRLTRDVELRYTASGKGVANFTLAVDRPFLNAQGQKDTDFIRCVAWGKLAENCANYTSKGSLIAVEGWLQVRQYESNGHKYTSTEVVAERVQFLERRRNQEPKGEAYKPENMQEMWPDDEEPPF